MSDELIKLGGLWINKKQGKEDFLAGNFGMARILVFKNSFKALGSNEPDYVMYIASQKPKPEPTPDKPAEE